MPAISFVRWRSFRRVAQLGAVAPRYSVIIRNDLRLTMYRRQPPQASSAPFWACPVFAKGHGPSRYTVLWHFPLSVARAVHCIRIGSLIGCGNPISLHPGFVWRHLTPETRLREQLRLRGPTVMTNLSFPHDPHRTLGVADDLRRIGTQEVVRHPRFVGTHDDQVRADIACEVQGRLVDAA